MATLRYTGRMDTMTLSHALSQLDIVTSPFDAVEARPTWSPDAIASGQAMLVIVLRGSGSIRLGERLTPVRAGQLWLINGAQAPELSSEPDSDGLALATGVLRVSLLDGRNMFDFIETPHVYDAAG
ncbi:MAG: cupin domain-containing protein, partial [Sphingomonadaceae bacterium]